MTPHLDRGERGHADGSLLRKLTMVCLIVLVVSGLVVFWIGEVAPPRSADHPPAARQQHKTAGESAAAPRPPHQSREGGDGCGEPR